MDRGSVVRAGLGVGLAGLVAWGGALGAWLATGLTLGLLALGARYR